jgi:hypothetical protein
MTRTLLLLAGWIVFAGLAYKVATSEAVQTAVYNPFEILGISEVGPPVPSSCATSRADGTHPCFGHAVADR